MDINITVRNKIAKLAKPIVAVCGNSDYVVKFDFDSEWDAFENKTARFKYNGEYTDIIFTGNECSMPVIKNAYRVEIGVYAGDLHTTTPAFLIMKKSITSNDGTPTAPAPDVYDQLMQRMNELEAPEAVLYTGQVLTDKQKAQARKNIGAAGVFYVTVTFNENTKKYESSMGVSEIAKIYETSNLIPVLKVEEKVDDEFGSAYNLYKLAKFRYVNHKYSMLFVCSHKLFNEARPYTEVFDLQQSSPNTNIFHKEVRGIIEDDLNQFIKISEYSYGYSGTYNGATYSAIVENPQKYPVAIVVNDYNSEIQAKFKGFIFPLETITDNEVIYSITAVDSIGAKCIKKGISIPKTGYPVLIDKEISLPANPDILNSITGVVTANKLFNPDHPTDLVTYEAFRAAVPIVQSMNLTGATVGQTIKVKAVNEQGMPTAWEAADMSVDEQWELINTLTITEENAVAMFSIDKDSNGKTFSLKKATIKTVLTNTKNAALKGWLCFNGRGTYNSGVHGFITPNYLSYTMANYRAIWGIEVVPQVSCEYNGMKNDFFATNQTDIHEIEVSRYQNTEALIYGTIELWGVRT